MRRLLSLLTAELAWRVGKGKAVFRKRQEQINLDKPQSQARETCNLVRPVGRFSPRDALGVSSRKAIYSRHALFRYYLYLTCLHPSSQGLSCHAPKTSHNHTASSRQKTTTAPCASPTGNKPVPLTTRHTYARFVGLNKYGASRNVKTTYFCRRIRYVLLSTS